MLRQVKVKNGWLKGIPAGDPRITAFKGIPFAAPPVGENRWRAPQPAKDWEGVKECYTFGAIAMQNVPGLDPDNLYSREWNVDPDILMDEDCLYLNVWTPAKTADEKLPVFVWYYGGGLREGNNNEMEFDGERIARRGAIVVTVNYRVNVFGFFAHPDLIKEAPEAPTNFGHLDQQAGTRWVKENIAAFGGDPENITIGGQSAGGLSVCAQLTSPQNEGLFQKAVIMSGMTANVYKTREFIPSYEELQENGKKFLEFLGVKTLEEARKLDAKFIRDKCDEFGKMWGTAIDGKFLDDDPNNKFMKGERIHAPLIVGCTSNETRPAVRAKNFADIEAAAKKAFGDNADEYMSILGTDFDKAMEMTKINAVEVAIRAIKISESKLSLDIPLYHYIFDANIPGWDNAGTFHSSDLWFFFETLAKCWRPFKGEQYDLARQMCNYWVNFFKSGDPNGVDNDGTEMPQWKQFTTETQDSVRFADTTIPFEDKPNALLDFLVKQYLKNF